jgi:hypothetical protein
VPSPSTGEDGNVMVNIDERTSEKVDQERARFGEAVIAEVKPKVVLALELDGYSPDDPTVEWEAKTAARMLAELSWFRSPGRRIEPAAVAVEAERGYFLEPVGDWDEFVAAVWRRKPDLDALEAAVRQELTSRLPQDEAESVVLRRNALESRAAAVVDRRIDDGRHGIALRRALCAPAWKETLGGLAGDRTSLAKLGIGAAEVETIFTEAYETIRFAELVDMRRDGIDRLARVALASVSVADLPPLEGVEKWEFRGDDPRLGEDPSEGLERAREEERRDENEEQMRGQLFPIFRAVHRAVIKHNAKYAQILEEEAKGAKREDSTAQRARTMRRRFLAGHGIVRLQPVSNGQRLGPRHVFPNGLAEQVPQMKGDIAELEKLEEDLQENSARARRDTSLWRAVDQELAEIRDVREATREALAPDKIFPAYEWGLVKAPEGIPDTLSKREGPGKKRVREKPKSYALERGRVILLSPRICLPIEKKVTIDLLKRERRGKKSKELDRMARALDGHGSGQWLYFPKGGVGV